MANTPAPKKTAAKQVRKVPTQKPVVETVPESNSPEPTKAQRDQIIAEYEMQQINKTLSDIAQETQQSAGVPHFVRNLSGASFRMRLNRHTPGQQGIQLKPRGERGDMSPLEEVDMQDPILSDNVELGLIEIITQDDATNAISNQTINQKTAHPALQALRTRQDDGELNDVTLNVQKAPDEDSIVVAQLDNGEIAFERNRGNKGPEIKRPARAPGEAPGTPGNIPGAGPGNAPANEESSFLSDLRSKTTVNAPQGS